MRWYIIFVVLSMLLVGCGGTPSPVTPPDSETNPAYPEPAYPEPAVLTDSYPAPTAVLPQGPEFTINTPVVASDTAVTGTGAAGVPIRLINLTAGGETIGEATVDADDSFTIDVRGEMQAGDRIGLMLGTIEGTNLNREDFLRGPGYVDIPLVGIVFVTALVE